METIALLVIATYSFLGIEQVSIELDNPFGTDPSDLPVEEMAMNLYDDIALILYACDGLEATKALRARLTPITNRATTCSLARRQAYSLEDYVCLYLIHTHDRQTA